MVGQASLGNSFFLYPVWEGSEQPMAWLLQDRGVCKFWGVSHLTGKKPDQQDPHLAEGQAGSDLQCLLLPSTMRARHKCVAPSLYLCFCLAQEAQEEQPTAVQPEPGPENNVVCEC